MKSLLTIPVLAAILLMGCSTVTTVTHEEDVVRLLARYKSEAKIAAYLSSAIYLDARPEGTNIFVSVRNGVDKLIAGGQFDPAVLAAFLRQSLPINELKSERAGIFFMAGVMIFQEATGTTTINTPPIVKAFAEGIRDGIDLALAGQLN